MSEPLQAGVGRVDVTPPLGSRLSGYPVEHRQAQSVHDPLYATALVLKRGPQRVAMVSLDWVLIDERDLESVRRGAHEQTGITPENVTVCPIHTHTGPSTMDFAGWGLKDTAYTQAAIPKIVQAVALADAALRPVRLGIATTHSEVGVNRRGIHENHQVGFGANPWGPYDPTMTVLRFEHEKGPVATIVHYGAHATAMGQVRMISRDWPGVMIDRIESQTGAPVMFINGAEGDVGPRMNLIQGGVLQAGAGDGPAAAMEVGYRAATDAMRAYLSVKEWRQDVTLATLTLPIDLPYRELPDRPTAERALAAAEPNRDRFGSPMSDYAHWKAVLQALDQPPVHAWRFHQTLTRLGPVALVPIPGEVFSQIVLRIRQHSPFAYTLCASNSNGQRGYLVTREARARGGYEVWAARATESHSFADDVDDVLVRENLRLLRQLASSQSDADGRL